MFTGEPTQQLGLPNYNPNDHPDFLTDFNEAFKKLDAHALEVVTQLQTMSTEIKNLKSELARTRIDCGLTS